MIYGAKEFCSNTPKSLDQYMCMSTTKFRDMANVFVQCEELLKREKKPSGTLFAY